jgi:hypothetical protein
MSVIKRLSAPNEADITGLRTLRYSNDISRLFIRNINVMKNADPPELPDPNS